jgi:hypothetical protein
VARFVSQKSLLLADSIPSGTKLALWARSASHSCLRKIAPHVAAHLLDTKNGNAIGERKNIAVTVAGGRAS